MRASRNSKLVLAVYGLIAFARFSQAQVSPPDCITSAALYHQVNPVVLRAIAFNESSMQPWAIRKNSNGTYDIGLFQINGVHAPELAKYGIGATQLKDGCVSAYVGAWLYRRKVAKHGNTWTAVGAFHSETPALRDAYARKVIQTLKSWGAFPTSPQSAPSSATVGAPAKQSN